MNELQMYLKKTLQNLRTREGFIRIAIFLFIAGAYNLKHVASYIFMILFFLSIYTLVRPINKIELSKIEKYALSFLMVYFIWFVITSLIPGWEYNQTKRLGVELRFILAIPIYILLRQVKGLLLPLWYGVTVALWLGFIVVLYQVYILNVEAAGGYGKLLLGPMSVLYIFMFLARKDWATSIKLKIFSFATVIVGVVPVGLSGARTAYIMLPALALIWVMANYNWRKQLVLVGALTCVVLGVYFSSDTVKTGVDRAVKGGVNYSKSSSKDMSARNLGSTETRLEMMKAAYLITIDNPIFGIGSGNLEEVSKLYIKAGLYHADIGKFEHLHNIYADNSAKKGVPGLVLTLMMFFIPMWFFWKWKKQFYFPAAIGFYYVAGEIIAGLTIVAPIDRGNFVAISLVILSVCLSEVLDSKKRLA